MALHEVFTGNVLNTYGTESYTINKDTYYKITELYDVINTGDWVLNTYNDMVYYVMVKGTNNVGAKYVTFLYELTRITRSTTYKPTNLSASRVKGTPYVDFTWSNPSGITTERNTSRVTSIRFRLYTSSSYERIQTLAIRENVGVDTSAMKPYFNYEWTENLFIPTKLRVYVDSRGVYATEAIDSKNSITRSVSFSPTRGTNEKYIYLSISYACVLDGKEKYTGPSSSIQYTFKLPKAPNVGDMQYDGTTGIISCNTTVDAGDDEYFRTVTQYKYDVTRSSGETLASGTYETTDTSYAFEYDIEDRFAFAVGDYVLFKYTVTNKGPGGTSVVSKQMKFGVAKQPAVGAPRELSGRIYFPITISDPDVQITNVKLQLLRSVSITTEAGASASESWADTSARDNGRCKGLSIAKEDVVPTAGKITWLRVKYWTEDEETFYGYTQPVRLTWLETPAATAADDTIVITGITATGDGTDVNVAIAWDVAGTDDSNQTEVSWADRANAWISTDRPSTFEMIDQVWDEGSVTHGGSTYHGSTHVIISGMDEGKDYYVRARRILVPSDDDEETTYGPYSSTKIVSSTATSASVVLYAPKRMDEGSDLMLTWSNDGGYAQTYYMVMATDLIINDVVLASEQSAATSCTIPWDRIEPYLSSGTIKLYVINGSEDHYAKSATSTVKLNVYAELETTVPGTVYVQPVTIGLAGNRPDMMVSLSVVSMGVSSDDSLGNDSKRASYDTIHSDVYMPSWTLSEDYETEDLETAAAALASAKEDYDDAVAELEEAKTAYYVAVSAYNDAKNVLEGMDENDDGYAAASAAVDDAEDDMEDALDAYEAIDISTETEAYEEAISAYADAEADALLVSHATQPYVAQVTLPSNLPLVDGARYEVMASGSNAAGDTISNSTYDTFDVYWTHKAPTPSSSIALTANATAEGDASSVPSVTIAMSEPTGAFQTDVYDVYRVCDGSVMCAVKDVPLEGVVTDRYAAFGKSDLTYRIACRTESGDVSWKDYTYSLMPSGATDNLTIIVGWEGGSLTFERGVDVSDAYSKDSEVRTHMDGSRSAYWSDSISRTATYNAMLVRVYDDAARELLDSLKRNVGPCFVRVSDGTAYEADVTVTGIAVAHDSAKVTVQLSATEIDYDGAFDATIEPEEEETEEEES